MLFYSSLIICGLQSSFTVALYVGSNEVLQLLYMWAPMKFYNYFICGLQCSFTVAWYVGSNVVLQLLYMRAQM